MDTVIVELVSTLVGIGLSVYPSVNGAVLMTDADSPCKDSNTAHLTWVHNEDTGECDEYPTREVGFGKYAIKHYFTAPEYKGQALIVQQGKVWMDE